VDLAYVPDKAFLGIGQVDFSAPCCGFGIERRERSGHLPMERLPQSRMRRWPDPDVKLEYAFYGSRQNTGIGSIR